MGGDNTLTGGTGSDSFYITAAGDRTSIITDFTLADAQETIDLSAFSGSQITLASEGANTRVSLTNGQSLILQNVNVLELSASHFTGSSGADTLSGWALNDTAYGGGGNDFIRNADGDTPCFRMRAPLPEIAFAKA